MNSKFYLVSRFTMVFLIMFKYVANAQNLTLPESSQKAMVMQRIGLTDITINYHSPLAKERLIWGGVVPYNEVWRAGANENTVITFTTDVRIEGKPLGAGSYGLHMIPSADEWTIIFSKNYTSWGSFFYDKSEDALRVTVTPVSLNESQEWLSYNFIDLESESAVLTLRWEKLKVPLRITVDVKEIVYHNMMNELRGVVGFTWQAHLQASRYCLNNDIHLDQAMIWVDKSIAIQKNFGNLMIKSKLLAKNGDTIKADELIKKAMNIADEAQLNQLGYDLINQKKVAEAIVIFKMNVKRYPSSWNVYDSLGEAYLLTDDKKNAQFYYKKALSMAPDLQKPRIIGIIKNME